MEEELERELTKDKASLAFKDLGNHLDVLCECLSMSRSSYLDLSHNSLASHALKRILESIKMNDNLKVIDLTSNLIQDDGCLSLSSFLSRDPSNVIAISLPCNSISDRGCKALLDALRTNSHLKILDLRANYITDACIDDIKKLLEVNSTISEINVNKNDVSIRGMEILQEVWQPNRRTDIVIHLHLRFLIVSHL